MLFWGGGNVQFCLFAIFQQLCVKLFWRLQRQTGQHNTERILVVVTTCKLVRIEIPRTAERGMNVLLRLYCRRRCVDMLFAGIPVLIVAVGFAIKTEVYDGRDDDCVFRYKLPVSVIPRLHDEAGSTSWLYERSSSQLVERSSSARRALDERSTSSFVNACNITPFKWPDSQLIKPARRALVEPARRAIFIV